MDRPPRPADETPLLKSPVLWVAIAIVVALAAGLYYWQYRASAPPATLTTPESAQGPSPTPEAQAPEQAPGAPVPASGVEAQIRHPVPAAEAAAEVPPQGSLPPLNESDNAIQKSLIGAVGEKIATLSLSPDLIRRIVASVDTLARPYAAARLPMRPPPGKFAATKKNDGVYLSPENFGRYARYVKLMQAIDTQKAAAVYFRFYPLFQQAYEELGYPNQYFNDRLVEVIDHLLAGPEVPLPIELVPAGPMLQFADPELEDASVGRKLLVRIGPENAAVIKSKLRELRREVAREPGTPG